MYHFEAPELPTESIVGASCRALHSDHWRKILRFSYKYVSDELEEPPPTLNLPLSAASVTEAFIEA